MAEGATSEDLNHARMGMLGECETVSSWGSFWGQVCFAPRFVGRCGLLRCLGAGWCESRSSKHEWECRDGIAKCVVYLTVAMQARNTLNRQLEHW